MNSIMKNAGFAQCGVCTFKNDLVINQKKMPEGAKSVIAGIIPYYLNLKGNISIYAMGKDYHIVSKEMLTKACALFSERYPGHYFKGFCDSSPVNEVLVGIRSGLGVLGRNNLLLNEKFGSFVFIAVIITDMDFGVQDKPFKTCIDCGKCISFCKSGALSDNGFDINKCLSHISQKKGTLSFEEEEIIKNNCYVWGCDDCQLCCPYNKDLPQGQVTDVISDIDVDALEKMPSDRAFMWRGKDVLIRNIRILNSR